MGIRFACHVCERRLNIKKELAGKRGICPVCAARIRIPLADTDKSTPVDEAKPVAAAAAPAAVSSATASPIAAAPQPVASRASVEVASQPSTPMPVEQKYRTPASAVSQPTAETLNDDLLVEHSPVPEKGSETSSLDLLTEENEATWYVRPPSGGQYGPATTEVLRHWIQEGRVASNALLWREGWPQWRDAADALPEFAGRLPKSRGGTPRFSTSNPPDVPGASSSDQTGSVGTGSVVQGELSAGANVAHAEERMEEASRRSKPNQMVTIIVLGVIALTLILVLAFVAAR